MALPDGFIKEIASYGSPVFSGLPQALSADPEISVRYNSLKGCTPPADADIVPWCAAGCYLRQRPAFTFDVALHQGLYYVQDASSMFIAHILRQLTADGSPVNYLDACAAPGGKTTAAIDALPRGSVVVANEFVPARAAVLRENIEKWGSSLCTVTQGDTARFSALQGEFDIISADVPCSGEGMMRKDAEAVAQWSPSLVARCAERQRNIVSNLWDALRPGGYFIYSTCTFNRTENEAIVSWIIESFGAEPVEISTNPSWGIESAINSDIPCYRFLPGRIRGEGLFMAILRKTGGNATGRHKTGSTPVRSSNSNKKNKNTTGTDMRLIATVRDWLQPDAKVDIQLHGDKIMAVASHLPDRLTYRPALEAGILKGRDVIPSQALATSELLNTEAFTTAEVDYHTAIAYLRCESIQLDSSVRRGPVLLTFGGRPIGFVKNLGNRANNLYPKQWRILSQNTPDIYSKEMPGHHLLSFDFAV